MIATIRDSTEIEVRLSKDLRAAAALLTQHEARYLVDLYYQIQDQRKRAKNQVSAMAEEPHQLISWVGDRMDMLEGSIKSALGMYAAGNPVGRWSQSIVGIGPVISAGLLAHINIERAPTAGHIWNFAGLNPGVTWKKGIKRPWNADLKVLCWKAGDSFVKTQHHPESFYGPLYVQRRDRERERNLGGEFVETAKAKLAGQKIDKDTSAFAWYSGQVSVENARLYYARLNQGEVTVTPVKTPGRGQPMLPPAHINAMAQRWVVKLFLSHWHSVAYQVQYGTQPPAPYALALQGHAHLIQPPNWPM